MKSSIRSTESASRSDECASRRGEKKVSNEGYFMGNDRFFAMTFAGAYPHYLAKAEKKGRIKDEVDELFAG